MCTAYKSADPANPTTAHSTVPPFHSAPLSPALRSRLAHAGCSSCSPVTRVAVAAAAAELVNAMPSHACGEWRLSLYDVRVLHQAERCVCLLIERRDVVVVAFGLSDGCVCRCSVQ